MNSARPTLTTFHLVRDHDVSGISGEGVIAEGAQFSDGWVVTHWLDQPPMHEPKTDVWHHKGTGPITKIHGHGGATRIVWTDEDKLRRQVLTSVVNAFAVPADMCGPEAERAHLHRQLEAAVQAVQDGEAAPVQVGDGRIVEAVMPTVGQLLEQRDRARAAAGRAYQLADRWEAAHGTSMFLVRAAGAELRDELDDEPPAPTPRATEATEHTCTSTCEGVTGIRGLLEHVGVDTRGRDITVNGRVVDAGKRAEGVQRDRDQRAVVLAELEQAQAAIERVRAVAARWAPQLLDDKDHDWHHRTPLSGLTCRRCELAHRFWAGEACTGAPSEPLPPAAECSAQHHGFTDSARQCIRAAQHRGDHIDESGFHWSDTIAVYPASDGTLRESPTAAVRRGQRYVASVYAGEVRSAVSVHGDSGMSPTAREALDALADVAVREMTGPCAQHPEGPVIGGICGGCTQYPADMRPAPAADEDEARTVRRARLRNLLARADRANLTPGEVAALRDLAEAEIRDADTAHKQAKQAEATTERVRTVPSYVEKVIAQSGPAVATHAVRAIADRLRAALDGTEQPAACGEHDGLCFPEAGARCSAHGFERCALCHRNPGSCTGDLGGCGTWSDTGMHWDTCPNRSSEPLAPKGEKR